MSRIVVFGAGGRAGANVVAEAAGRGHEVTAVVRDPARYPELGGPGVRVVAGDVTDGGSVRAAAAGHDVAVQVAARLDMSSEEFYTAATRALVDGLGRAGVSRLVALGIGTLLEVSPGVRLIDTPGFPADARAFSLGHAAELELLEASELDWVVIAPPPVLLDEKAARTGRYRFGDGRVPQAREGDPVFSFADLAVAVVDEVESPAHHRVQVAVSS
ncbi:NAD-binding protein, putative [[Actinomadura] parvosata subsp. kistnae]|uniref:NAD(P)-dependent oxidoreductase n=1 Tax=[Actinomadura] parvosata TaxID=1955412 RepID=UPI000D2BCAEE|nr:NAD(P)H-binding protein [Nonomuraea sp. ATCC 55076]SPL87506.1 NAD-binding protein, putative [Actinomadura parvosata subsp. kistnae]